MAILFAVFEGPTDPPGACGGGSSQGGGRGGLIDLSKIRDLEGSQIMWSKIKLGNFSHSQNEENWIDFWVWETDFGSPRGHF